MYIYKSDTYLNMKDLYTDDNIFVIIHIYIYILMNNIYINITGSGSRWLN